MGWVYGLRTVWYKVSTVYFALSICVFWVCRFNQPQIKNITKYIFSYSSKEQNLNLPTSGNYDIAFALYWEL